MINYERIKPEWVKVTIIKTNHNQLLNYTIDMNKSFEESMSPRFEPNTQRVKQRVKQYVKPKNEPVEDIFFPMEPELFDACKQMIKMSSKGEFTNVTKMAKTPKILNAFKKEIAKNPKAFEAFGKDISQNPYLGEAFNQFKDLFK